MILRGEIVSACLLTLRYLISGQAVAQCATGRLSIA